MIEHKDLGRLSFKTKLVKAFLKFKIRTTNEKPFEINAARAMRRKNMTKVCGKVLKNVKIDEVNFTEYPAYFYTPPILANSDWVVLFLHGGAYVASDIDVYSGFACRLCVELALKVYSFDYPLAPEHPYPCGVHAVIDFYKQLLKRGQDPGKIIIMGDSAGGGLSLVAAKQMQKENLSSGCIALFSPWVDMTMSGETIKTNVKKDLMITQKLLTTASHLYVGRHDRIDPGVSPVFADYKGFPPVYILAAADELLCSESEQLHDVMERDGVDVYFSIWAKAQHAFIVGMHMFPEGKVVMKNLKEFIYLRCKLTTIPENSLT